MIEIRMNDSKTQFAPYALIEAEVKWSNIEPTDSIKVELFWNTRGRGSVNAHTAETIEIPVTGQSSGRKSISIHAPIGPYSFSGQLISLIWFLAARGKSDSDHAEVELIIAPGEKEIKIDQQIQVVDK